MIGSTYADADRMTTAIDLLEQLVGALELREEADPDSPPWLADQEVRRLEREIVRSLRGTTWQPVEAGFDFQVSASRPPPPVGES